MSMLANVSKGKIKRPHLVLVYGPDGVGKTTFGSEAPEPIFLGAERGTDSIDTSRFPGIKTWDDSQLAIRELLDTEHKYKSLVIDSLDWLEPLLFDKICKADSKKSIELCSGGYGKGYIEALNMWIEMRDLLTALRDQKSMNVVLIAHSDMVNFQDPQTQIDYKRYELKLHKKASAMFREYVDAVLFCNFETFIKRDGAKTKAYGDGARVMHTERRPGFDAKNRFGLPMTLPLSWADFCKAVDSGGGEPPEKIRERINAMLTEVTDDALKKVVLETVAKAGENARQLEAIANRLAVRIGVA